MVTLYSDPLLFDPFSIGFISVMGAYICTCALQYLSCCVGAYGCPVNQYFSFMGAVSVLMLAVNSGSPEVDLMEFLL